MDSNAAVSSHEGASDAKIDALANYWQSDLFTAAEKLALELADAMTSTPPDVNDELFERLRAVYTEAQLVELAAIVAQENFRSRFNTTFRLESQGKYCPVPTGPGSSSAPS